ncbi:MAG: tRNA1(Val) (adenine(37)-N6)-methyltransferase [bacterium]|nr:tRNA1(Val) (adenine(37)-N6)-methyltransferase [bacterium]
MKRISLKAGEAIEDLRCGSLKIIQKKSGYRFSVDAVLLAGFAGVKKGDSVVDLGSGSGVIPLILSARHENINVTGIELDGESADMARRSIGMNNLSEKISIVEGDIRGIKRLFQPECFNSVLANPPYGKPDSGRINPNEQVATARHEIAGNLDDFLKAASYLLKYRGRLSIIYPARRVADLIAGMRRFNVEPKRMQMVHSREGDGASLVLVEGVKGGGVETEVMKPLYIYAPDGSYTGELEEMYR